MLLNSDSLRPKFTLALSQNFAGLAEESLLSLHVVRGQDTVELAVAAVYSRTGESLQMQPMTELDQDKVYLLRWRTGSGPASAPYRTPGLAASKPAKMLRRYPQSDTVPANLLFLQFRFDSPMRPDVEAWTRIHIREAIPGAEEIPFAWRQRCFWLDSDRVLQLMIHPGRVKTGIHYGGPLLVDGHRYEIRIDSGLIDARGNPVDAPHSQYIVARAEDHMIPQLESLSQGLRSGTRDPLQLQFSEEMDCSGLLTGVHLFSHSGKPVVHAISVTSDGKSCLLVPTSAWPEGNCRLELDSEIRDLGANTLRRRFEIRNVRDAAKDRVPLKYVVRIR